MAPVVVTASMAIISRARRVEGFQGDPQDLGNFFLERDDRLGPLQLPLQPTVLGFELFRGSTGLGLGPRRRPPCPARRPARAADASW